MSMTQVGGGYSNPSIPGAGDLMSRIRDAWDKSGDRRFQWQLANLNHAHAMQRDSANHERNKELMLQNHENSIGQLAIGHVLQTRRDNADRRFQAGQAIQRHRENTQLQTAQFGENAIQRAHVSSESALDRDHESHQNTLNRAADTRARNSQQEHEINKIGIEHRNALEMSAHNAETGMRIADHKQGLQERDREHARQQIHAAGADPHLKSVTLGGSPSATFNPTPAAPQQRQKRTK